MRRKRVATWVLGAVALAGCSSAASPGADAPTRAEASLGCHAGVVEIEPHRVEAGSTIHVTGQARCETGKAAGTYTFTIVGSSPGGPGRYDLGTASGQPDGAFDVELAIPANAVVGTYRLLAPGTVYDDCPITASCDPVVATFEIAAP